MREIKFRVWSILDKRMLTYGHILNWPMWEIFPGTPEQRAVVPMQYMGRKDSSEKEIYEGDILKTEYQDADGKWLEYIGYVWYRNPDFVIRQDLDNGGYQYQDFYRAVKIIGNIYENPELLK